jgi:lipid II:glycine glycyltransferase (peptidoglycan interpeptide bridge formation enzyme)
MVIRKVLPKEKEKYNQTVPHIVQSWEWGDFRKKTSIKVIRLAKFDGRKLIQGLQLTIHPVPHTPYKIGYVAKGALPDKQTLNALGKIGREENLIFIKIEPHVLISDSARKKMKEYETQLCSGKQFIRTSREIFARYSFLLDLSQTEDELLSNTKEKTRYNIRLAQRKGVKIEERTDEKAFKIFLDLYFKTCQRQKYFGHDKTYHRLLWETLKAASMARVLLAIYKKTPLVAWIVLNFKDVAYYPYGGSSLAFRNTMASNLVCWEAIRLGKRLDCKTFDLWGCLGSEPNKNHPWYGFHRFKAGYGGKPVEYIGSYDLVLNPGMYKLFNLANQLRWKYLRVKTRLPL